MTITSASEGDHNRMIFAPWSPEQVENLNRFQYEMPMHPFTCGDTHHARSPRLVATADGWVCPDINCPYTQNWAHAFMARPEMWPTRFEDLRRAAEKEQK